ncbi:histidinol dehydrogenase [Sporocytophaga myxococcoides]|uniref:Histidinol dehydrogenase n=1 Tax=Sporocytophaga myxococcoides TaxID=153721 RepID=A0A098L918_9BACT|nr:histidinol dehydrogenase [Sporocytophaga myxococcoides]GAL83360.1 histidinol dehydrogenase [Sporocytophaga myxococcoides]
MKIIKYPETGQWKDLLKRPVFETASLEARVIPVLEAVKKEGDIALKRFTSQFDGVDITDIRVSSLEIDEANLLVDEELKIAIRAARQNIEKFHSFQKEETKLIETTPGVTCWRKSVPIQKVGFYIPGGTAPLFSTILMLAIPADIAGCEQKVLCTPPNKEGKIHPAILFTANLLGIKNIYKVGGAQAIAAMAYGTETVPQVYKIFGPGNQYVTAAKQLVFKDGVAIDMPAGPSEVAVVADDTANPAFVASDLLSQAEHGVDSQVMLFTKSEKKAIEVLNEVKMQTEELSRKGFAEKSLENSKCIVLKNDEEIMHMVNEYAPEHLILQTSNAEELAGKVINAGSVFIGHYTPESAGDYASGTNHTLPTNGYAKAYSGVSVDSFVKKITFQSISKEGIKCLGPVIETMAAAEALDAHKNAVSVRLKSL